MSLEWTPTDDAALKEAALNGVSAQRLAVRYRRTVGSIKGRLNQLGVKTSPLRRLPYNERNYH